MSTVEATIEDYFQKNSDQLLENYPGLNKKYLLEKFLEYSGLKSEETYIRSHQDFFDQLKSGVPLEYLTHSKYFYRSLFYVNQDVLIPRSETEILVEKSIFIIMNNQFHKIAEIGVGSGCIALSIAQEVKNLEILATDISPQALEVAKINYKRHQQKIDKSVDVTFKEADRLTGVKDKFDLIVSNPPYIKRSDEIHVQVQRFEPQTALFLPDEEYDLWFRELFDQVSKGLNNEGVFLMEGHEDHLASLQKTALEFFTRTEILQDYTQRDRFLIAYL